MIAIAMNRRWKQRDLENLQMFLSDRNIAELGGGVSKVKNATIGGAGRQRIKKAAADGEYTYEKYLEYER
jgi:hypothetical protein